MILPLKYSLPCHLADRRWADYVRLVRVDQMSVGQKVFDEKTWHLQSQLQEDPSINFNFIQWLYQIEERSVPVLKVIERKKEKKMMKNS